MPPEHKAHHHNQSNLEENAFSSAATASYGLGMLCHSPWHVLLEGDFGGSMVGID